MTAGEYTTAAGAYGLATGFGDTGSVGIGGLTLGGGVGYLVRKYGLTIDNLLAAEIVTADGQLLRVDAETHPDLFWAIRGGGGNFGVATRFQFRLHEVDTVVGGHAHPAGDARGHRRVHRRGGGRAGGAVDHRQRHARAADAVPAGELHGKLIVMAMLVYAGDAGGRRARLAPFRALATPIADMVRPMRYPEIYPPEDRSYHPTAVGARCSSIGSTATWRRRSSIPPGLDAAMRVAQLRVLGGAMARVPARPLPSPTASRGSW